MIQVCSFYWPCFGGLAMCVLEVGEQSGQYFLQRKVNQKNMGQMLISLTSQASGCICLAPYSKSAFLFLRCTCRKVLGTYQLDLEGKYMVSISLFSFCGVPTPRTHNFSKEGATAGYSELNSFLFRGYFVICYKSLIFQNGYIEIPRQKKISRELSYSPSIQH